MLPNCLKQEDNIDKLSIPDLFLFINKDPLLRNAQLDSKLYSHHSQSCQMLFFFQLHIVSSKMKYTYQCAFNKWRNLSIYLQTFTFLCYFAPASAVPHRRGSQQYTYISFIQVIQFCSLHIETLKSILLLNYNNAYYLRKKFVQRKQRTLLYISAHT